MVATQSTPAVGTSPPRLVQTYEFSYSRSTGKMRFRLHGSEWKVDRLVGQWEFLGTDRHSGNLTVRCLLTVRNGTAYVYVPGSTKPYDTPTGDACKLDSAKGHDECLVGTDNAFPQGRHTFWRVCYARELAKTDRPCWRLRDERTGELWFVNDYRGLVNVSWMDNGSHIFITGPATLDGDLVAHFP